MGQPFDPYLIVPFSVIRIPYRFLDQERPVSKLFVVLGHKQMESGEVWAYCIKTTSNVRIYENDERRRSGCVCYEPGSVPCFPVKTYVEPDNTFPISHRDIIRANTLGGFEIHPALPSDFKMRLCRAIAASITMDKRQKNRMIEFVGCP